MSATLNSDSVKPRRFKDADSIWNGGARNRLAVAKALVNAIQECRSEGNYDGNDPAVWLIIDHLCFLVGLPQPSIQIDTDELSHCINEVLAQRSTL